MAKLTLLLSSIALLLLLTTASADETTHFNYDFNGVPPTTLTYQGTAQFRPDSPYLTLTPPMLTSVGRVLHTAPVPFRTGGLALNGFESVIKFIITPAAGNGAEGIAFFVAPVGTPIPSSSAGGHLGVFNVAWEAANTLVVEFDANPNADYDPSYPHVGIDIGTIISSNVTNVGGALVEQEVTAHIKYVRVTSTLTVTVTAGGRTYEVSSRYPLSVYLNDQVQFGLSASTYLYTEARQEIISWHNNYTVASPAAPLIREVVV